MNNHLFYAFGSTSRHRLVDDDPAMMIIRKAQQNSQKQKEMTHA